MERKPTFFEVLGRVSLALLSLFIGLPPDLWAAPQGAQVVRGQVQFQQQGSRTTIHASDRSIINYSGFDIQANETLQFIQPHSRAWVLNRVLSDLRTEIYGAMLANGRVLLVNPSGIYFSPSARVEVGRLVASTLDISNESFLSNDWVFEGGGTGALIVDGEIRAEDVVLIGKQILNNGSIVAPGGLVVFAAGERVLLRDPDDSMYVEVDGKSVEQLRQAAAKADAVKDGPRGTAITNTGTVETGSGRTLLMVGDLYSQAFTNLGKVVASVPSGKAGTVEVAAGSGKVETTGTIEANSPEGGGTVRIDAPEIAHQGTLAASGGKVALTAGDTLLVSGVVSVAGTEPGTTGGVIHLLGDKVGLIDSALIDASGEAGGGTILVGGDYQGKGSVPNASRTYVGPDVTLTADATNRGDGGTVVVWSDEVTRVHGAISAKGGQESGNGGLIETSGKDYLEVIGATVDASAAQGLPGTWLLDPRNVTVLNAGNFNGGFVGGNFTPSGDDAVASASTINTTLSLGTNVTITTGATGSQEGDITVEDPINKSAGGAATLTLQAQDDIFVNASITGTSFSIVLSADYVGPVWGNVYISAPVTATGGNLTIYGNEIQVGAALTAGVNINLLPPETGLGMPLTVNMTGGSFTPGTELVIGNSSVTAPITIVGSTVSTNSRALNVQTSALFDLQAPVATGGGAISLVAGDVVLNNTVNAGGGSITLRPYYSWTDIGIGTGANGTFSVNSTEMQNLGSSGWVTLGQPGATGNVNIFSTGLGTEAYSLRVYGRDIVFGDASQSANVTLGSWETLELHARGSISRGIAGAVPEVVIPWGSAAFNAVGSIVLSTGVSTLAARSSGIAGGIALANSGDLSIGTVGGLVGLNATNGTIQVFADSITVSQQVNAHLNRGVTLNATVGDIWISADVMSTAGASGSAGDGAGTIQLMAPSGSITTSGGATRIRTAGSLDMSSATGISVRTAVAQFTAQTGLAGGIWVQEDDRVSCGAMTADGSITVTTLAGNLTVNQPVTAGGTSPSVSLDADRYNLFISASTSAGAGTVTLSGGNVSVSQPVSGNFIVLNQPGGGYDMNLFTADSSVFQPWTRLTIGNNADIGDVSIGGAGASVAADLWVRTGDTLDINAPIGTNGTGNVTLWGSWVQVDATVSSAGEIRIYQPAANVSLTLNTSVPDAYSPTSDLRIGDVANNGSVTIGQWDMTPVPISLPFNNITVGTNGTLWLYTSFQSGGLNISLNAGVDLRTPGWLGPPSAPTRTIRSDGGELNLSAGRNIILGWATDIFTTNANQSLAGNLTMKADSNGDGSGTISVNDWCDISTAAGSDTGNITVTADDVYLSVLSTMNSGTGNIIIQPSMPATSIGLGAGLGNLSLDGGELAILMSTRDVIIGRLADGTGDVDVTALDIEDATLVSHYIVSGGNTTVSLENRIGDNYFTLLFSTLDFIGSGNITGYFGGRGIAGYGFSNATALPRTIDLRDSGAGGATLNVNGTHEIVTQTLDAGLALGSNYTTDITVDSVQTMDDRFSTVYLIATAATGTATFQADANFTGLNVTVGSNAWDAITITNNVTYLTASNASLVLDPLNWGLAWPNEDEGGIYVGGILNLTAYEDITLDGNLNSPTGYLPVVRSTGPGSFHAHSIWTTGGNMILDFDQEVGSDGDMRGLYTDGGELLASFTGNASFWHIDTRQGVFDNIGRNVTLSAGSDLSVQGPNQSWGDIIGHDINTRSGVHTTMGGGIDASGIINVTAISGSVIMTDTSAIIKSSAWGANGIVTIESLTGGSGWLGHVRSNNATITLSFLGVGADLRVESVTAALAPFRATAGGAVSFNAAVGAGTVDVNAGGTITMQGTASITTPSFSGGSIFLNSTAGSLDLNNRPLRSDGDISLKAGGGWIDATGAIEVTGGDLTVLSQASLVIGTQAIVNNMSIGVTNIVTPWLVDLVATSTGTDAQNAGNETNGVVIFNKAQDWSSLHATGQQGIAVLADQSTDVGDLQLIAITGDIRTVGSAGGNLTGSPASLKAEGQLLVQAEAAGNGHSFEGSDGADAYLGTLRAGRGIIVRVADDVNVTGTLNSSVGSSTGDIEVTGQNLVSAGTGLTIVNVMNLLLNVNQSITSPGPFIIRNAQGGIDASAAGNITVTGDLDWTTSRDGANCIELGNAVVVADRITLTATGASGSINISAAGSISLVATVPTLTLTQGADLTIGGGGIPAGVILNSDSIDLMANSTNGRATISAPYTWNSMNVRGASGVTITGDQSTDTGGIIITATAGTLDAGSAALSANAALTLFSAGDIIVNDLTGRTITVQDTDLTSPNTIRFNGASIVDVRTSYDVLFTASSLTGTGGLTVQNVDDVNLDISSTISFTAGSFVIAATGEIDATAPQSTTVTAGSLNWSSGSSLPGAIDFGSNDLSGSNVYLTVSDLTGTGSINNTDGTLSVFSNGILSLSQSAPFVLGAGGAINASEIGSPVTRPQTNLVLRSSSGTVTVTDAATWNSLNVTGQTGVNIAASQAADDESIFLAATTGNVVVNAPLVAGRNMTLQATGAGGQVRVGGTGNLTVANRVGVTTGTLTFIQNSALTINASTGILNATRTDFVPQSTGGTLTLGSAFTWNSLNATGQQGLSIAADQNTTQDTFLTATTGSVSVNAALNSSRDMTLRAEGIGGTIQSLANGSLRVGTDRTLTLSQYANLAVNTTRNIQNTDQVNLVAQSTGGQVQFNELMPLPWNSLDAIGQTGVTVTANQSTDNGDLILTSIPGSITATGTTLTAAGGAVILQAGVDVLAGNLTGEGVTVVAGRSITFSSTIDGQSLVVYLQAPSLTAATGLDIEDASYVDLRIGILSVGGLAGGNFNILNGITGDINAAGTTTISVGSGSTLNWAIDPSVSADIVLAPGTSITNAGSVILFAPNGNITGAGTLGVGADGGVIQLTQAGSLNVGTDVGFIGTTGYINLNVTSTGGNVAFDTALNVNSVTATGQTGVTVNGNLTTDGTTGTGDIALTAATGNVTVARNLNSGQAINLSANSGSIDMANVALAANTDLFLSAPNSAINTTATTLSFTGAGNHRYEVTQQGSMIIGGANTNLPVPAGPAAINLNVNSTAGTVTVGQAFTWNGLVIAGDTGITISGNQTADSGNISLTANTGNISLGNGDLTASQDMFLIAPQGAILNPGNINFTGGGNHTFALTQLAAASIGAGLLNFTALQAPDIDLNVTSTSATVTIGQAFTWNSLALSGNTGITLSGNQTTDAGDLSLIVTAGDIDLGNSDLNSTLGMTLRAPAGDIINIGTITLAPTGPATFTVEHLGAIDTGTFNISTPDRLATTLISGSSTVTLGQAFTWDSLNATGQTGVLVLGNQTTDTGDLTLTATTGDINGSNRVFNATGALTLIAQDAGTPANGDISAGNLTGFGVTVRASDLITLSTAINALGQNAILDGANLNGASGLSIQNVSQLDLDINNAITLSGGGFVVNAGQILASNPATISVAAGGDLNWTATTDVAGAINVAGTLTADNVSLLANGGPNASIQGTGGLAVRNDGGDITVSQAANLTIGTGGLRIAAPTQFADVNVTTGGTLTLASALSLNSLVASANQGMTVRGSLTTDAGDIRLSTAANDLNLTNNALSSALGVSLRAPAGNITNTGGGISLLSGTPAGNATYAIEQLGALNISGTGIFNVAAISDRIDMQARSNTGTVTIARNFTWNSLNVAGQTGLTIAGNQTADSGALTLTSGTGGINATTRNLAGTVVTLAANTDILAGNMAANGGAISVNSAVGSITAGSLTGTGALTLSANAGNITAGALNGTDTVSATTTAGSVTLAGDINAGNVVTVTANTDISAGNVTTTSGAIAVNSVVGSITGGNFTGNGTLTLRAQGANQNITAGSLTGGEITVSAGNRITLSSTLDSAGQNVTLQGESLVAASNLTIPNAALVTVDINTTIDIGNRGNFSITANGTIEAGNPTAITFTAFGGALNWTSTTGSINLSANITFADLVSLDALQGSLFIPTNLSVNDNGTIALAQLLGFNLTGRTVQGDNVTFSARTSTGDIVVGNMNFTGSTPGFGATADQGDINLGTNFTLTDASSIRIWAPNGTINGTATLGVNGTGDPINLAQNGTFALGAGVNLTGTVTDIALTVLAGSLNIANIANDLYALNLTVKNGDFDLQNRSLNATTDMALVAQTGNLLNATGNLSIGDGRTMLISQQGDLTIGGGGINAIRDSSGDLDEVNLIVQSTAGSVALNVGTLNSLSAAANTDLTVAAAPTADNGAMSLTATTGSINASGLALTAQNGSLTLNAGTDVLAGNLTAQNGTLTLNAGGGIQAGSLTGQGIAVNAGAAGDIVLSSTLNGGAQDVSFAGRNLNATTDGLTVTTTGNIAFNNTGTVRVGGGNFTVSGANITALSPTQITVQGANLTLNWQALNGTIAAGNMTATGITLNAGSDGTIVLNSTLDAEGAGVRFTALALNSTHGLTIQDANAVDLSVQTINISGGDFAISTDITGDIDASGSSVSVQGSDLDWRTDGDIAAGDLQADNVVLFAGATGTITLSTDIDSPGSVEFDGQALSAEADGLTINANLVDFHAIQTVTVGGGDLAITAAASISGAGTDITASGCAVLLATDINNLRSIQTGSDLTVEVGYSSYVRSGETTLEAGRALTLIGYFNIDGTLTLRPGTDLDISRARFGPNTIVDRPLMAEEVEERDSYIAQVEGTNAQALFSLLALGLPGIEGLLDWTRAIPEAPELSQIQDILNQLAGAETRISAEAVQTFEFYPEMRVGEVMLDRYSRLYIGEPLENLLKQLAALHGFLAEEQHLTTLVTQLEADIGKFDALVLTDPWLRQAREFLHLTPMFLLKVGQDPELAGQMLLNLCAKLKKTHPKTYEAIEKMVKEELED